MLGHITVSGIRFHAYHGLTKLERQVGVRHCVDVEMLTDIRKAAKSDQISDTIDYREIHDLVVRVGRENSFHLIETLVERIATEILENHECQEVEVSVRKETPVLDGILDTVGVRIRLNREDLGS